MAAISMEGVTKRFPDGVVAVDDLTLTVEEGEIFGFLGPNGAGKSTTINILLDFVRPTAGTVEVLGHEARSESVEIRHRTGVLPEAFDVYDRLTGRQHIEFAIESKAATEPPAALLDRVGLLEDGNRPAGDYSSGMRQRLALAMALVGEPDLLILDEPSTGLDPNGAREMREIVTEEVDRGATVFFSSHILGQVEAVCDRVGILRDGALVALDSVDGLRDAIGTGATLRITTDGVTDDARTALESLAGVHSVALESDNGTGLTVQCSDTSKTDVIRCLEEHDVTVHDFETEEASLEELFQAYTTGEAGRTSG